MYFIHGTALTLYIQFFFSISSFLLPLDAMLAQYAAVRLSVTRRYCEKMAKLKITQTTLHDSPGTLVF